MAIHKYTDNDLDDDQEYPLLTKRDIANENARNRLSHRLVPLGSCVYDLNQMYQIITSRLPEILPKHVKKELADDMFGRMRSRPSTYLALVGTCKSLGIPNAVLQDAKDKCIKGHVRTVPTDEEEKEFKRNMDLLLGSLSEDDTSPYMAIFKQNCEQWLLQNSSIFEDKFYPALTQYQDHIEFPKPMDMTKTAYIKPRPLPCIEKQEEYVKKSASLTMEGINEVISTYTQNGYSQSIASDQKRQYLLHYCKLYLQSCEVQVRECTVLKSYIIPDGDPNKVEFPLPSYSKTKQMRLYLLDDTCPQFVFDMPLDGYAWKHLAESDIGLYKNKTDEVNDFFEELVAKRCRDELFCTDINEQECVWKTYDKRENVIKNDILAKKQVALVKSREQRTDLFDNNKIKKRWSRHLRYFLKTYHISNAGTQNYKDWFGRYEESKKQFERLCDGTFQPTPREPFDKVKFANEQYQLIMSQVPKLTPELKQRISNHRYRQIKYFMKRYHYSEERVAVYGEWLETMEQNQMLLEDLCENGVKNQNISKPNYSAVFTNYSTFENMEE